MPSSGSGDCCRSLLSCRSLLAAGIFIILILATAASVHSADFTSLREKASPGGGDIIMVDGPFYVSDKPYYTLDFMVTGTSRETRVYSEGMKEVGGRTARKVLAVRDMKYILIAEPLFYAPGDPEFIIKAGEYDIQNARNVADISDITAEERDKIEEYFSHYRQTMKDIAEVNKLTNEILYPSNSMEIKNDWDSYAYDVSLDSSKTGYYSYEGFKDLITAYEKVVEDYRTIVADLEAFSDMRGFEGQENIDKLLSNLSNHGDSMEVKVLVRSELVHELGRPSLCGPSFVLLLSVIPPLLRRTRRALPLAILLSLTLLAATAWTAEDTIPTPDELALQLTDGEDVSVYMETKKGEEIDFQIVQELLENDPSFLILEGEIVTVRGPYYHHGGSWYFFEISKDGELTGGAFVYAEDYSVVRNQRQNGQIIKALRVAATLEKDPIYSSKSAQDVRRHLEAQLSKVDSRGPMKSFIEEEIANLEKGEALEKQLIEKPDFETLVELNQNLFQGFILLSNIERITSKEEAAELTSGFTVNVPRIEAIVTISSGLTAEEYYVGKRAKYIRRSIIKIPELKGFAETGEPPSKGYFLSSYIIQDTIHDNVLIYREETGRSKFVEEYLGRWRTE